MRPLVTNRELFRQNANHEEVLAFLGMARTRMLEARREVAWLEGLIWDAPEDPLEVEIYASDGDPAFICAVRGRITVDALQEIEEAMQPTQDDYYARGPGTYMVRPDYFEGQAGFEGQWEIAPGWGADHDAIEFLCPPPSPMPPDGERTKEDDPESPW